MDRLIEEAITDEAKKRLARYSQRSYYSRKYQISYTKRTGKIANKRASGVPKSWLFDKHFDPRYCINHSRFIARGIWNSLKAGSYKPRPALRSGQAKLDGSVRYIDAFSIPDAAIASIFMKNLRKRNAKIFSDSSFAYQERKTPLDAVLRVKSMLREENVFVSQYDFSGFFDNIDQGHVEKLLEKDGPFLTTNMERQIIRSVFNHEYSLDGVVHKRITGTPQGHSLSLFTSNVAAHALDMGLSKISCLFARFADDSVVVNYSYEDALKSAAAYRHFSSISGVPINLEKSTGIRLLSNSNTEMRSIDHFNFLSYRFSPNEVLVSERTIRVIKMRCAKIIYRHLLLHPRRALSISESRVNGGQYDWDLVTALNELRNYIYGGVKQSAIDQFLLGNIEISNIQGAVSYFSLVEKSEQFRMLDGWLLSILYRAIKERVKLVRSLSKRTNHRLISSDELLDGSWYRKKNMPMETTVPSFFTAWRASRKSLTRHGLGGIDAMGMGYSYQ